MTIESYDHLKVLEALVWLSRLLRIPAKMPEYKARVNMHAALNILSVFTSMVIVLVNYVEA